MPITDPLGPIRMLQQIAATLRANPSPDNVDGAAMLLDAFAIAVLAGHDELGKLIAKTIADHGGHDAGLVCGPQTDAMAMTMLRSYGPRFMLQVCMNDEHPFVEVCAHHMGTGIETGDDPARWVVVGRGLDVARTIVATCERLRVADAKLPDDVELDIAALELPEVD